MSIDALKYEVEREKETDESLCVRAKAWEQTLLDLLPETSQDIFTAEYPDGILRQKSGLLLDGYKGAMEFATATPESCREFLRRTANSQWLSRTVKYFQQRSSEAESLVAAVNAAIAAIDEAKK